MAGAFFGATVGVVVGVVGFTVATTGDELWGVTVMTAGALVMPALETVMVAVPAATGVTNPVALTVATAVLLDFQVSAAGTMVFLS